MATGVAQSVASRLAQQIPALLPALLTAACVLPQKPQAEPPRLDAAALDLRGLQVPAADARWWAAFADPQLAALLAQAAAQNPSLAAAQARLRAAQAQLAWERAGLWPAAEAGAAASRGRLPDRYLVPPPFAGHVGWIGEAGASLDWSVDLWGLQADAVQAQAAEVQASRLDAAQAQLLVESAVVQAYIEDQRASALAALARREVLARERLLELARLRADAALDSRVAQQQAEALLLPARNQAVQARAALELAQHELAALSGSGAANAAPHLDLDAVIPVPQAVPVNLLARRPDVIAARLEVAAAEARCRETLAAYYPSVDLSAVAGFASFGLSDLFRAGSRTWSGSAAVSLPLFDAGRLHAQQRGAEAERDERVAAYNAVVLRAVQQAADQLSLIQALERERAQQRGAIDAAGRAWQLESWRAAAALEDQRAAALAELDLIDAERADLLYAAELALARVRLLLAVGGSFDPAAAELHA